MHIRLSRLIFIHLAVVILMAGCGVPKNKFRLDGKFKHLRSADIFIYSDAFFDTLHIRDGKFSFEHTLTAPEVYTIMYPDFSERKVIAEPGRKARFTTDANDLSRTRVKGTDENDLLTDFYIDISTKHGAQVMAAARKFVAAHPETLAAEAVFRSFILSDPKADGPGTIALIEKMQQARRGDRRLRDFAATVTPRLRTLPGAAAPEVRFRSFEGKDLRLSQFRGRWLLITYWATWQYDSFQQVRSLRRMVRPYGVRLALVNVCLDIDTRSFRNTLRRDTVPQYNVCDRLAWRSPLVQAFGVQNVPSCLLITPGGKVAERDIASNDLAARLQHYLNP